MPKTSNLFEIFRRQTQWSIMECLDSLSINNLVFSNHQRGFSPYLEDNNIIIYISASSMVVVCFDLCGRYFEIAQEEPLTEDDSPFYYSDNSKRISPVWELEKAMKFIKEQIGNEIIKSIFGVLITESKIRNADDMIEVWNSRNICVFYGQKDLRHREISTLNAYNPKARDVMLALFGKFDFNEIGTINTSFIDILNERNEYKDKDLGKKETIPFLRQQIEIEEERKKTIYDPESQSLHSQFINKSAISILDYLKELGRDTHIYSEKRKGISPLLSHYYVYIYATECEWAFVLVDNKEEIDAGKDNLVWDLALTCELFRNRLLRCYKKIPHIYGILLTNNYVIDYDELCSLWNSIDITVIGSVKDLANFSVSLNTDEESFDTHTLLSLYEAEFTEEEYHFAEYSLISLIDPDVSSKEREDALKFLYDEYEIGKNKHERFGGEIRLR